MVDAGFTNEWFTGCESRKVAVRRLRIKRLYYHQEGPSPFVPLSNMRSTARRNVSLRRVSSVLSYFDRATDLYRTIIGLLTLPGTSSNMMVKGYEPKMARLHKSLLLRDGRYNLALLGRAMTLIMLTGNQDSPDYSTWFLVAPLVADTSANRG